MNFGGAKSFAGADRSEKDARTAFSTDMRPDFMNESHGISADRRFRSTADDRSPYESGVLDSRDRSFDTRSSRYDRAAPKAMWKPAATRPLSRKSPTFRITTARASTAPSSS